MPESSKTTLTELSARFYVGGPASVKQRYPQCNHFLVVAPDGRCPPPMIWTPQKIYVSGTTRIGPHPDYHNLPGYAIPDAVVVPIEKTHRNSSPEISLGRAADADIRISSNTVSKVHALFKEEADRLWVRDNGSTNGTRLNDMKLSHSFANCQLQIGNELQFGDVRSMYVDFENLITLLGMLLTD